MKINRKAITPLMATLLLISFAVAVGVVIMNFGRAQVEEGAACTIEIGLKLALVGGEEQFCFDKAKKELFFTVENGINIKVESLMINAIGTKQVRTYNLEEAQIEKAGLFMKYLSYNTDEIGELRQLKIIPKIKMFDEELICQEKAVVVEKVRDCKV